MIKSLSIIIPTHNNKNEIIPLINSIYKNNIIVKFEIIIVLDNCSDSTEADIKKIFSDKTNIKLIENNSIQNKGAGPSRHLGAQNAQYDILLFIDADVIVPSNTINNMLNDLNTHNYNIALLSLYKKKSLSDSWGSNFLALKWYYSDNYYISIKQNNEYINAHSFGGGPSMISKDLYFKSKGFNATPLKYNIAGGEEFQAGLHISDVCPILYSTKYAVPHKFKNVFSTFILVIKRAFNFTMISYNLKQEKRKLSYVVPNTDKYKLLLLFLIIILTLISTFYNKISYLNYLFIISYIILTFDFLKFIYENKGFGFTLFSFFVDILLLFFKGIGISFALFNILILKKKDFRF